jgi:hypothetical protein
MARTSDIEIVPFWIVTCAFVPTYKTSNSAVIGIGLGCCYATLKNRPMGQWYSRLATVSAPLLNGLERLEARSIILDQTLSLGRNLGLLPCVCFHKLG